MKVKIITVSPHLDRYENICQHYDFIRKATHNKRVAIASSILLSQELELSNLKLDSNYSHQDLFDNFFIANYDQPKYWEQISEICSNSAYLQKMYLSANLFFAQKWILRAKNAQEQTVKNYCINMADFYRTYGWVDDIIIKNDVQKNNIEVLLVDLYLGCMLDRDFPGLFELVYEGLAEEDRCDWKISYRANQKYTDYNFFRKWYLYASPIESGFNPHISGHFLSPTKEKIPFEIFINNDPKLGTVEGIISDAYGLAIMTGKMNRNSFLFKKRYFIHAIDNDVSNWINDTTVNYELLPALGEGFYHLEGEKNKRECECKILRKLY